VGAVGGGVTLRTHDFECVGKAGKEGGGGKAKGSSVSESANDVPVAPKLDLVRMRARGAAEGGSVTDRTMRRLQVCGGGVCRALPSLTCVCSGQRRRRLPCPAREQARPNCACACACAGACACVW
jgi:hypothetical protein